MKQTSKILSIAALFALGAISIGCSSLKDELDTSTPENNPEPVLKKTVTITSTVGLDAPTKALTALGVKTFAADETIAVFYTNESSELVKTTYTFTDEDLIDGGQKAMITVSMTDPSADAPMKYIYPASMANDNGTVNYAALAAQDGTLATLAANYDLATYDGTLTGEAALPESVTLSNHLTIGEFTVKDWGGAGITTNLTEFTVTDGTNTYAVTPTGATFASSPVYVAMQPITADKTLTFTATDGTTNYFKSITGKALARNNMYPVGLKMNRLITITAETGAVTLADGDIITGTGGTETHVTVADGATVTLADVNITGITHDNSHYWAGITCEGDATILLSGTNAVMYGANVLPGVFVQKVGGERKTLTIDGDGSLTATGLLGAGIGGRYLGDNGGNVIINGGTITATSQSGAGIGGGDGANFGSITINGGTITASSTNMESGAGIGSGLINLASSQSVTIGDITITGGDVTAISYAYGAGIGTGYCIGGTVTGGNILISGGTVTAYSLQDAAAAIGSGAASYDGGTNICGTVTIGSDVTSVAVGIVTWSGYYGNFYGAGDEATCGTVTIDGHPMTADEMHNPATCTSSDFPTLQWSGPASVANPYKPDKSNYNLTVWTLTQK